MNEVISLVKEKKTKRNEFGVSCKKKINAKWENYFDFVKQLKTFILL